MLKEISVDELKKEKLRGFAIGMSMIIIGALLMLLIAACTEPTEFTTALFAIFAVIMMIGAIYLILVGDTAKNLIRSYEILKVIEPEYLILTRKFVLAKKDEIYMITPRRCYGIWFLRFRNIIKSPEKRIKLPRVVWRWEFKKIDGIKVARREGEFIIPNEKLEYIKGHAVAYFVETERIFPIFTGTLVLPLSIDKSRKIKENLEKILNHIKSIVI